MQFLEATAKQFLARAGIAIPNGVRLSRGQRAAQLPAALLDSPVWVKAQVPTTKRLQLGGVRRVQGASAIDAAMEEMEERGIGGIAPLGFLVEEHVVALEELFVAIVFDPVERAPVLVISTSGGRDVEASSHVGRTRWNSVYPLYSYQIREACARAGRDPEPLVEIIRNLARLYLEQDATLLEINPLFVTSDGTCIAGDAHLVVDDNAGFRHPEWESESRLLATIDESLDVRRRYGFDYSVIDGQGEVGLLTTGAGATMMIVDEFSRRGIGVLNFADIRTGALKGNPARLLAAVERILAGPNVRAVLINVFGGVTDTAEVAQLLVEHVVPVLAHRVFVTIRLVGRGGEQAREVLQASRLPVYVTADFDDAIGATTEACRSKLGFPNRSAS